MRILRMYAFCVLSTLLLPAMAPAADGAAAAVADTPGPGSPGWSSPMLLNPEVFSFPPSLIIAGKTGPGYALVRLVIDADGLVRDAICTEASRMPFAVAATYGMALSQFRPAMQDGVGMPVRTTLRLEFRVEGTVSTVSISSDIDQVIEGMQPPEPELREVSAAVLDERPRRVDEALPVVFVDADGNKVNGKVRLSFYIDYKGQVRLPQVLQSDSPEIAAAALVTVRDWRFTPPLQNGQPRAVKVAQTISYGD
jgi:TonB family protein